MYKALKQWISTGAWLSWLLIIVVIWATVLWIVKLEALPQTIRLASGSPHGQYHIVGTEIAALLEQRTGRKVEVVVTSGAIENAELLKAGQVHLALLQSGSADMQGIRSVAPLYPEPIHVVARKSAGLSSLEELVSYRTAVGQKGSGMYGDAVRILNHLRVESADLVETEDWVTTLMEDSSVIGAIVTTGMLHPGFRELMATGEFELLPVLDAGALAVLYPYMKPFAIPRGMYSGYPPEPPEPVETVTATSFIGVRSDVRVILVESILKAIYEDRPADAQPAFIPPIEIEAWPTLNHHIVVELYHDPIKDLSKVSTVASSVSAVKELLLAIAAAFFLLYRRLSGNKKRKAQSEVEQQQAVLNELLRETLAIESAQIDTSDVDKLRTYLDEVTKIKLRALGDASLNNLRERGEFSVFMMQCAALVNNIQNKISSLNSD